MEGSQQRCDVFFMELCQASPTSISQVHLGRVALRLDTNYENAGVCLPDTTRWINPVIPPGPEETHERTPPVSTPVVSILGALWAYDPSH